MFFERGFRLSPASAAGRRSAAVPDVPLAGGTTVSKLPFSNTIATKARPSDRLPLAFIAGSITRACNGRAKKQRRYRSDGDPARSRGLVPHHAAEDRAPPRGPATAGTARAVPPGQRIGKRVSTAGTGGGTARRPAETPRPVPALDGSLRRHRAPVPTGSGERYQPWCRFQGQARYRHQTGASVRHTDAERDAGSAPAPDTGACRCRMAGTVSHPSPDAVWRSPRSRFHRFCIVRP